MRVSLSWEGKALVMGVGGIRQNVACCVGCSCISGLEWGFIGKDGVLMELEIH